MDEKDKKRINPNRRLRAAREQRGWSQAALAEQLGTTELTVGRWERGERSPQLYYRSKLCELFGMTAEDLGLVKGMELEISEGEKVFPHAEAEVFSSPEPSSLDAPALLPESQSLAGDRPSQAEKYTTSNSHEPDVSASSFAELSVPSRETDKEMSFWRNQSRRDRLPIFIVLLLIIGLVVSLSVRTIFSVPKAASVNLAPARSVPSPNSSSMSMSGHMLEDPPGTPIFDDPITHYNIQTQWGTGKICTFVKGVYHMHSTGVNYCLANARTFIDFHYQILVTLLEGSQAGVVFRADGDNHLYYFYIDMLGRYGVELVNQPNPSKVLRTGPVHGLKQTNELDVVVLGSDLRLYVNRQLVAYVQDSTFPSGYIGVCVDTYTRDPAQANITTATFHDAKVWT